MENQRLFLVIGVVFVGVLLFSKWNEFQHKASQPVEQTKNGRPALSSKSARPGITENKAATKAVATEKAKPGKTSEVRPTLSSKKSEDRPTLSKPTVTKSITKGRVIVRTDVFLIEIDKLGGDIRQVDFLKFSISKKDKRPFRIMVDRGERYYVTETGFDMDTGQSHMAPASYRNSVYSIAKTSYKLNGNKSIDVTLDWKSNNGVKVTKTYTFYKGRYDIDLKYTVTNGSNKTWVGATYQQLTRANSVDAGQSVILPTYKGGAIFSVAEGFEKISFAEIEEKEINSGRPDLKRAEKAWVGMLEHYFTGAWIAPKGSKTKVFSLYDANLVHYKLGMQSQAETIKSGSSKDFDMKLYIGPKDQVTMATVAEGLDRTVDYGILSIISKGLFWLLTMFHSVVGNWGFAIILLTILVKGLFYKLSAKSYRSMAKMRKLSPRMKQLKERHGDNRQAYTMAIQEMFKKEKVNPLGGCLPILVQIPVFIALYWVLLEGVELRQAPFIFWIQDLSVKDPFFILPLLMGASMFLQHKLNPPQVDPMQQKIMMALPIVFTVFFMFFSSGLVLYWLVNNILSISQQWYITKQITGEEHLFSKQED